MSEQNTETCAVCGASSDHWNPQHRMADTASALPQSEHGGLHPELRARITAAKAALADYERPTHDDKLAWMLEADRLAAELRSLLEVIDRHPS